MNTFSSKIFFSLEPKEENIGNLLKKCSSQISSEQRVFYQTLWKKNLKKNKRSLFSKVPFEKEEKKAFLEAYGKKKQNLEKAEKFISFMDELLFFLESKNEKRLEKGVSFLSRSDSLESTFLKNIVEIILALGFDNPYRAEKKIKIILKTDPAYFIFNPTFPGIKKKNWLRVEKSLFRAFSYIRKNLKNNGLEKMLFTYLDFYHYFKKEDFNDLVKGSDLKWSLSEIRELSKKPRSSSNYLFFLSHLLIKKKLYSEHFLFLKEQLKKKKINKMSFTELSLLATIADEQKIKTTFFQSKIKSLLKQKNDYYKFLIFKIMEKENLKSLISNMDNGYKRANFQLEYSFYSKKLLNF